MKGTKSLQDLFTDRGVPRSLRGRVPVVTVDGEIAWVAGVAVSEEFRLDARLRAGRRAQRSADRVDLTVAGYLPGSCHPRPTDTDRSARSWSPAEDLQRRVRELAAEIDRDYARHATWC